MKLRVFLMLILILFILTACAGSKTEDPYGSAETPQIIDDISTQQPEEEYIYPDSDYGGIDFKILNYTTPWNFYTDIVFESESGEALDDSIYKRNRTVEEKFNINIVEVPVDIGQLTSTINKSIAANDDIYDAVFCSIGSLGSFVVMNAFYNLDQIPSIQLEKPWWNQNMREASRIGRNPATYFAACDINLMSLQSVFCLYFNENMFADLGLERPYDLVKEGKWTYDALHGYVKVGAQLNGDTQFATNLASWDINGSSVFGMATYSNFAPAMIIGGGESFILKDSDNMPYLTPGSERLTNVFEKLADMIKNKGEFVDSNVHGDSGFLYTTIFRARRALFIGGEIKEAFNFKDMDDTFGILPFPKYDEKQDKYHSMQWEGAAVMVILSNRNDTEKSGAVMDALAYESTKIVTPTFFDLTMTQKRLRNDESIEMMGVIRDSIYFDIGVAYGWTGRIRERVPGMLWSGDGAVATLLEKVAGAVQKEIDKTMQFFD